MRYFLFIDESDDHGLKTIDESFPVFLLCGVLISEDNYTIINSLINNLKIKFWNNTNVILHSRDIRKCNNEFKILFDLDVKQNSYADLNMILKSSNYKILSSAIDKIAFIKKYGKLEDDVYEISLSSILDSAIFCLNELQECTNLEIIIEKRGKREDIKLANHLNTLSQIGTFYFNSEQINNYAIKNSFVDKKQNCNGIQMSDLLAYPIAKKIIYPQVIHISFDLIKNKLYPNYSEETTLNIRP